MSAARVAELEDSTRETYLGYIERTIKPALGAMLITKLLTRHLETLYMELRRCRVRCGRKPFVEHKWAVSTIARRRGARRTCASP
jgi:hypothetical protein